LEGFVKVNVIGQQYMNRHRQIKCWCTARGTPTLTFSSTHNDAPNSWLL